MNINFHMAHEGAGREAPAAVHAVVGHAPLHRTLEARQGLRRQCIDALGDAPLRLRQTRDMVEYGLVAFRGLRGTGLAGHDGIRLFGLPEAFTA